MDKRVKQLIVKILTHKEAARNCDTTLVTDVWYEMSPESFFRDMTGEYAIKIESMRALGKRMPIESITRARRKIQREDESLWPTDIKVASRRKMKAKEVQQTINQPDWHANL